jgi:organic radical activating enzyme
MTGIVNVQPQEGLDQRDDGAVEVHSIWDTMQGEGPYAGTPATFVRLTGCNLACRLCDTEYTGTRDLLIPNKVLERVNQLPRRKLVVITGGEPFRQNIIPLVACLLRSGRDVQIETNGTVFLSMSDVMSAVVVCSPKTPRINDQMWRNISCLKYVVQDGQVDPEDGLPLSSVGPQYGRPARPPANWKGEIYVQPLDEQDAERNEAHLKQAVASCMKFGYRLCLQTHKMVGLP